MSDQSMTYLALILFLYFIPAIVASARRHRNRSAIGVLNLFLGWTLLGWVAALVWANTADVEPRIEPPPRRPALLLNEREYEEATKSSASLRAWERLTGRSAKERR